MTLSAFLKLLALGAIWGGSFLFMRICVPVMGPVMLIAIRVLLAALFLLGVAMVQKRRLDVKGQWKHFLILGLLNSAVPFVLFAYAAHSLSASLLSILNATSPIWGAVITAILTRQFPSLKALAGLALGVAGVSVLVGFDSQLVTTAVLIAVAAGLFGAFLYAVAAAYSKTAKGSDSFSNAHGSMWGATLAMMPLAPFFPAAHMPGLGVIAAMVALGVVCSGIAYILYFQLVDQVGAASALTVTFLVPVFGTLWGWLFLHEHVGWETAVGGVLVVTGTALITGFSPAALFAKPKRLATEEP